MDETTEPPPRDYKLNNLGQVLNLEEHVRPDWWRLIFNSIYLKTDGDVVEDKEITLKELDLFLKVLNPSKQEKILDLCCGQGRHSLELARRGFNFVEGLDRSRYLIKRAKETARKEGIGVKFREGDARKLLYPADSFDIVMILGNSFGYFETIQEDIQVLKEVFRVLKPGGKLIIDLPDGDHIKKNFQLRSWEWMDKKNFVCRERSLTKNGERLISREIVSHIEKGVFSDRFYSERLYSKEDLKKIFLDAGFFDVSFPDIISVNSKRNQDLGMMAERIVAVAQVRKGWSPLKKKIDEIKNVLVILGDPSKKDNVKPSSVFDEDDFYTINQLKNALREIESNGYRFIYLDNHYTLLQDLIMLKEKIHFVFNLCDEGLNNDARKELHIPSLLEQLNIPYTGAGPQSLAYCYDKSLTNGIAEKIGVPTPKSILIKPGDSEFDIPFGFPLIVKPNFGDSGFGITQKSVVNNTEELLNAISDVRSKFGYDKPILVEEFLNGKEFTVGIIGTPPTFYTVLPIIEEDYSALPENLPKICGYEAKWYPDSPYWNLRSIPVDFPDETKNLIIESCLKLSERLECRDYVRFDWRMDSEGNPKLLEVNPNPGWCWDGHFAKMAKLAGISYPEMIKAILNVAEQRLGAQNNIGKKQTPLAVASGIKIQK